VWYIFCFLQGPGTLIELEAVYIPTEQLPAISEHLTVVEIKCGEVDGRVYMILMFLSRLGRQIKITPDSRPSTCKFTGLFRKSKYKFRQLSSLL
jgi:hypothetical protein